MHNNTYYKKKRVIKIIGYKLWIVLHGVDIQLRSKNRCCVRMLYLLYFIVLRIKRATKKIHKNKTAVSDNL